MADLIGSFVGAFGFSLGLSAIWLIIALIIPPLRRRPRGVYIVAMILAFFVQLIRYGGPGPINFVAGIACVALLYFQMKRAERKLTEKYLSNETERF
jgi:hypothetical protein